MPYPWCDDFVYQEELLSGTDPEILKRQSDLQKEGVERRSSGNGDLQPNKDSEGQPMQWALLQA